MTTATSIKIDDELKQRVQQITATRQRSAHWIMREAIREYVEREEKREALRKRPWHPFVAASISWPIILRPVGPLKIWKLNLGNGRTIFGNSGYIALYHFDGSTAVLLAVRYQSEAGY